MSEKTSPLLSSPITIRLWGTNETKSFERISDIIEWSDREANSWIEAKPTNTRLAQIWQAKRSTLQSIRDASTTTQTLLSKDKNFTNIQVMHDYETTIRSSLAPFETGATITTAHPHFATIQALAETDANAGAALLCACLNKGNDALIQANQLDAIARIGATPLLDRARKKAITALRDDLAALKKNLESDISTLRSLLDESDQNIKDNLRKHKEAIQVRETLWEGLIEKCDTDWTELKRVYDEKLALLAPTEYWRTRATNHRRKAIGFAVAFVAALTAALWLFISFGISHLAMPDTQSTFLAVLPVLVPAFAGVWVLRILGRMLSENLAISQDAEERETMVKTFLALMRDETTGKSVVTDEDRRIILHALFRASTVTATDDSPPINLAEVVRKIGAK